MMELFSIYDMVAERYMRPFWGTNVASAIRGFGDACNDADAPMYGHVEDYALYTIATFDEVTGEIKPITPFKVASGSSYGLLGQLELEVDAS